MLPQVLLKCQEITGARELGVQTRGPVVVALGLVNYTGGSKLVWGNVGRIGIFKA